MINLSNIKDWIVLVMAVSGCLMLIIAITLTFALMRSSQFSRKKDKDNETDNK